MPTQVSSSRVTGISAAALTDSATSSRRQNLKVIEL